MNKVNLLEAGLEVGDTVWFLDGTTKEVTSTTYNTDMAGYYPLQLDSDEIYTKYGELMNDGTSGISIFLAPVTLEIPTKKPEPVVDWEKEFVLGKPFMFRDEDEETWKVLYAGCYLTNHQFNFFTFSKESRCCSCEMIGFVQARKLTKKELEEHKLPLDVYEN